MDSPDNRLWRNRADFQQDSLMKDSVSESPSELDMEDVMAGFRKISIAPHVQPKLKPIQRAHRKKETSRFTTRILAVFDALETQMSTFEKDLECVVDSPSQTAFEDLFAKLSSMQSTLDRNQRRSALLDEKRALLAPKLVSLHNRLQELRALLPECETSPREYPIGE
jgi:hypothetical protein